MERKYALMPEKLENPDIHSCIRFDFGPGFAFRGFVPGLREEVRDVLREGDAQELPLTVNGSRLTRYTGGKYPEVLRLFKDIPTFDSGDRKKDSWHEMYLISTGTGVVQCVYCTGGYVIAEIVGFQEMLSCPAEVEELLHD